MPQAFDRRSLRYFFTFANVHTLKLQGVEIYRFIPQKSTAISDNLPRR